MRVLRVYPFLPPMPGGMEKHVLRLSQEQRLLGCDVAIMFNSGCKTAPSDLTVLPIFNLHCLKPQALRDFVFFLFALFKIYMWGIRADVVHIHGDWSAFLLGRLLGWAVGARVMVASVHGVVRKGRWATVYRRVLSGYAVVYCTGAGDAKYLYKEGVAAARWQNSGIDADFFNEARTTDTTLSANIVCVANFFPVKNLALVIEIAKSMPDMSFLLIGDGPERPKLEESCERDVLKNVRFAGNLSAGEISLHLRTSHVFLSTSFTEGTPTALLEAMACGLPIVTSCSNDYRELIQTGRNGYVIDNFDAKNYVRVLSDLLSNQRLLQEISVRNKLEARCHAWPKVAEKITNWMRSAKDL
jgi:glycosyltransferase involved in cell wall biosynthesis